LQKDKGYVIWVWCKTSAH